MEALCRNGRHPYSQRRTKSDGSTSCLPCGRDRLRAIRETIPGGVGDWAMSVVDTERVQRLHAWQATVDDAIAEMRQQEGFDGTTRDWQTLGECLLSDLTPARPRPVVQPRTVKCDRCQVWRFVGRRCASCAAGLDRRAS